MKRDFPNIRNIFPGKTKYRPDLIGKNVADVIQSRKKISLNKTAIMRNDVIHKIDFQQGIRSGTSHMNRGKCF